MGTASYGNLRFSGKYCGSLFDAEHWEYNRVGVTVGDDHPHAAHEVFIWYHDAKFEDKDIRAILQQPEWREIPIGEDSADIRIGAKVAKAWRNPSGSLLTIRENGTMAFYMGPGVLVQRLPDGLVGWIDCG